MDKVKAIGIEVLYSILQGVKLFLTWILPTALVAVLASSEFRDYLATKPEVAAVMPVINVVLFALVDAIKKALPENISEKISKVL